METNYPSSGSKGSAGIPGSGSNSGTANTTGSQASSGRQSGSRSSSAGSTGSAGMGSSGMGSSGMGADSSGMGSSGSSAMGGSSMSMGSEGSGGSNLRDELSNLKRDLDDLVSRATSLSDRELSDARDKMMMKFSSMRHAARGMADQARTQINQGVDVTSDYVKEKPLQSVAIAAGVGLLIGALMRGGRD